MYAAASPPQDHVQQPLHRDNSTGTLSNSKGFVSCGLSLAIAFSLTFITTRVQVFGLTNLGMKDVQGFRVFSKMAT
jgi:hypothetical protein